MPRLLALGAGFLGSLLLFGCGGDGFDKRYPVTGTVTYKGEPVSAGTISFIPKDPSGRGATGQIKDGIFAMTTVSDNDGALPGDYRVVIDTRQIDQAKADELGKEYAKKQGLEEGVIQMVPQEIQAQMLSQTKSNIPGKYQIPETSDLDAVVEEKSNTFEFVLTD